MNEYQDMVIKRLERLRDDIVSSIEQHGITASGRTQRSIEVETYADGVRVVARSGERAPIPTLEIGRPPGNIPGGFRMTKNGVLDVSNTFKAILMQWARDKHIDMNWGGATMLGRRIAAEGTLRHKRHENVYSSLVQEAAEDVRATVINSIINVIKSNI